MPELLAPAGSFEKLQTAIHYGADAVYLGGSKYGLRAKAGNFNNSTIVEAVYYAHSHGVKIYVTANIIAHSSDFTGLSEYLMFLERSGVDGVIISDPGIFMLSVKTVPNLPIHLSTQANVTNVATAKFWIEQGAVRLNLARELSLEEICEVRLATDAELEVFVHGALCISYSGRCMLSNYMTGRDANQGNCAHPCRYSYALIEEKRPNEYFRIEEDDRGSYIFNSKDLCLLRRLPELVAAGVNSLKIEGRMKSIFYVGGVVRIYRAALDYLASLDASAWQEPSEIVIPQKMLDEIARTGTRDITENFFDEKPGPAEMLYHSSRFEQQYEPVCVVREGGGMPLMEMRNVLHAGETVEYMMRGTDCLELKVTMMFDQRGREVVRANPGNMLNVAFDRAAEELEVNGIIRRKKG